MTHPTIDALPTAPVRGEDRTTFAEKANAWVNYMPTYTAQLDAFGDWIDAEGAVMADYVAAAQVSSDVAMGGANYKGAWSALTGALNMPASVSHDGLLWLLNANLANVTTKTPGVAVEWVDYASFLSGTALLPAVIGSAGQMLKVNASGTAYDFADFGVVTVTGNLTLDATHHLKTLIVNAAAVITFPAASTMISGYTVTIIRNTGLAVTLARTGTDLIDSYTTYPMNVQWESLTFIIDKTGIYFAPAGYVLQQSKVLLGRTPAEIVTELGLDNVVRSTVVSARGDMVYRSSSALTRLAKGTEGYQLTMNANDPQWSKWKTCLIGGFNGGIADLVNATYTAFTPGGDGGQITISELVKSVCPVAGTLTGFYIKCGNNSLNAAATATVFKNGVATAITVTITTGSAAVFSDTTNEVAIVAGDTLTLQFNAAAASSGQVDAVTWGVGIR